MNAPVHLQRRHDATFFNHPTVNDAKALKSQLETPLVKFWLKLHPERFLLSMMVALGLGLCLPPAPTIAQQALVIKRLAEMNVTQLPAGPLFWRLLSEGQMSPDTATKGRAAG